MPSNPPIFHVIRARAQFLLVQKSPVRYARPQFVCSALPAQHAELGDLRPHVGFTITKKCGNAVVRNRIRRRLREALKAELLAEPLTKPLSIVILARSQLADMPYDALRADIKRALSWVQHKTVI